LEANVSVPNKTLYLCVAVFFVSGAAQAATFFVMPSGSNGNGSSWSSPWVGFSSIQWASVTAGSTVCLGGGAYSGSLTLSKSGTSSAPITVKRATASDPVCGAGIPSGADSQITLTNGPTVTFSGVSWVVLDGMVDSGIKIKYGRGTNGAVSFDGTVSNDRVSHLELQGPGMNDAPTVNDPFNQCSVGIQYGFNPSTTFVTISHNIVHDGDTLIHNAGQTANNVTYEYNTLYNSGSGSAGICHPNATFWGSDSNLIFRYNIVHDIEVEGLFFPYGGNANVYIYGNVFYNGGGRSIEPKQGSSYGPFFIYNNTFGSGMTPALRTDATVSGQATNNLLLSGATWNNLTTSNNVTGTASMFVNSGANNYHLVAGAAAINAGKALATDGFINKDMDGKTRGADGTWDVGAYEFSSGSPPPPPPPPSGSACDVNSDGTTNVVDVQQEVNQALGTASCTADINKDGQCTVVDVQRVVNAALGGQCVSP
jgi:hypothetical protein